MAEVNLSLSVIALNIDALKTPVKETDWQNEFLKIIQLYAVYKGLTSNIRTQVV